MVEGSPRMERLYEGSIALMVPLVDGNAAAETVSDTLNVPTKCGCVNFHRIFGQF